MIFTTNLYTFRSSGIYPSLFSYCISYTFSLYDEKYPTILYFLLFINLSGKLDTSSAQLQKLSREVNPPYFEPSSCKEPKRRRSRIAGLFNYPNLYQPKKSWCLKFFFRSSDLLDGLVRIS